MKSLILVVEDNEVTVDLTREQLKLQSLLSEV